MRDKNTGEILEEIVAWTDFDEWRGVYGSAGTTFALIRMEETPNVNVHKCRFLLAVNEKRWRESVQLYGAFIFHLYYAILPSEYPKLFNPSSESIADQLRGFQAEVDRIFYMKGINVSDS